MSITLKSLCYRAVTMALVGVDNDGSYIETGEMLAETLVPQVTQAVVRDAAADPLRVQQVQTTVTLTFADGIATLPTNVLTEFLGCSTIDDPADDLAGPLTGYMPWVDFRNGFDDRQGGYAVHPSGSLYYAPYGMPYDPSGTNFAGDILLTTPADVTIPSDPDEVIVVSPEIEDAIVTALASSIKSEAAWQNLSSRLNPGDNED